MQQSIQARTSGHNSKAVTLLNSQTHRDLKFRQMLVLLGVSWPTITGSASADLLFAAKLVFCHGLLAFCFAGHWN
jgi:hypothetical protein